MKTIRSKQVLTPSILRMTLTKTMKMKIQISIQRTKKKSKKKRRSNGTMRKIWLDPTTEKDS